MKKVIALLLALCMILAFAGCGKKEEVPVKDTLTIAFSQDQGTLDAHYLNTYDIFNGIRMIYEPLWDYNTDGTIEWVLATGIDYISDTVWHINLREGVKFANGNDFTAEDVVFTLDKANHREGLTEFLPELDLENTKALDDHTVEFVLKNYDFSYMMGMCKLLMYDKESYNADTVAMEPMGTGPYELESYTVNSNLNLVRRDDYWGEKPAIKYLKMNFYAEDAQKTNALQTGAVDICSVPFQDIEFVQTLEDYNVNLFDEVRARALFFNITEHGFFHDNLDARRAVCLALDRGAMCELAYGGYASSPNAPISEGSLDCTDDLLNLGIYGEGQNLEEAKKLAESSGLVGQTLTLSTPNSSADMVCAQVIERNLAEIGVKVEINTYDFGTWIIKVYDAAEIGDMYLNFTGTPSKTFAQSQSCWYWYALDGDLMECDFPGHDEYDAAADGIMAIRDDAERHDRNLTMAKVNAESLLWYALTDTKLATGYAKDLKGYAEKFVGGLDFAKMYWEAPQT